MAPINPSLYGGLVSYDDLLERIRARAYDPARRCDYTVGIPLRELVQTTDPALAQLREQYLDGWSDRHGQQEDDRVVPVAGGSPEAVAFFRGVDHEPLVPPLSVQQLKSIETRLGMTLPELFRRVYTEVGDGGFGPGYGIYALGEYTWNVDEHFHPVRVWEDSLDEDDPNEDVNRLGLGWCDYGCGIREWVSLTEPGNPVRTRDPDKDQIQDLLARPGVPLVTWFENWLAH